MNTTGTINVQSQNIFPIIKKYLYSDHDIFLRELVSNAADACNKLKHLAALDATVGETGDFRIDVTIDEAAKTLTIADNGIGMTAEEIDKYINQIAFSGATEFMDKYKDANIIGHFGLGFYSAFMVADKVELITKSYQKDAQAMSWTCEGNPEFELAVADKESRGTQIILHIGEDYLEYLEKSKIQALLDKHCKYYNVPIYFDDKQINNVDPLWNKKPQDLTDKDYLKFYEELHPYSEKPLFWIHLNVDFPFHLNGILYFPKIQKGFEVQKNKIQLYSNNVYVTDEVKDIVPEFLQLLHGVIDSPDIPLNVSRSYLQSDSNVKKITAHITKKVADKLEELFKNERPAYEEKWESIGLFVKYGMVTDTKFIDRGMKFCLLKDVENKYYTFDEYSEKIAPLQTDKNNKIVHLYTTDKEHQHAQVEALQERGYSVLLMDEMIDQHFVSHIEYKNENITYKRVDADTTEKIIEKENAVESVLSQEQQDQLKTLFETHTKQKAQVMVQLEALSPSDAPVQIIKPEFIRRMEEMQQFQNMQFGPLGSGYTLVVNSNHAIAAELLQADADTQLAKISYLHHIALLQMGMLKGAELTAFVKESFSKL